METEPSSRATIRELNGELADAVTSNKHINAYQAHTVHLMLYELRELHDAKERDEVELEEEVVRMIRTEIAKVIIEGSISPTLESNTEQTALVKAAQRMGQQRAQSLTPQHQSEAAKKLAEELTPTQRSERASKAAKARWSKRQK